MHRFRPKSKPCALELLESRCCLSAISFLDHVTSDVRPKDLKFFDPDADGDLDVLYSSGTIGWFENTDDGNRFGTQHILRDRTDDVDRFGSVETSDMDGDGDTDVVFHAVDLGDHKISWLENSGGEFKNERLVTLNRSDRFNQMLVADLDGDADQDVVAVEYSTGFWTFRNLGTGLFSDWTSVSFEKYEQVFAIQDLNGDGLLDILTHNERRSGNDLAWYENNGSDFNQRHVLIPDVNIEAAHAVDLDRDSDVDIIVAIQNPGARPDELFWLENTDTNATYERHDIYTGLFAPLHLTTADLDGDLDEDILAVLREGRGGAAYVYENVEGEFAAGQRLNGTPTFNHPEFGIALSFDDLDGDGDLDFVALEGSATEFRWFEQVPLIGDVNGDDVFDSSDLVSVFAAGKYDLGTQATFDEGDWNGDGVFDSSDLVLAFRLGTYESGRDLAAAIEAVFAQDQKDKISRN